VDSRELGKTAYVRALQRRGISAGRGTKMCKNYNNYNKFIFLNYTS